ncbi:MAG: hypothetical protein EU547_00045 [Promethearchaeota archaeon]|nr:MAG: hypothetical protein EU547_00045 [Candidatus Lokiarchaeota archaeon]
MANMTEKLLLIGFGIFTIISFFSILNPYINVIFDYNNHQEEFDNIIQNIDEIDASINYVSEKNETYINKIYIFKDLNLTINNFHINYSFHLIKKTEITKFYEMTIEDEKISLKSETSYYLKVLNNNNNILEIDFIPLN